MGVSNDEKCCIEEIEDETGERLERVDGNDCWDGDTKGKLDFTGGNIELYGFRCAP